MFAGKHLPVIDARHTSWTTQPAFIGLSPPHRNDGPSSLSSRIASSAILPLNSGEWFFRFFILDYFFHHAIHLNDGPEFPRPPLLSKNGNGLRLRTRPAFWLGLGYPATSAKNTSYSGGMLLGFLASSAPRPDLGDFSFSPDVICTLPWFRLWNIACMQIHSLCARPLNAQPFVPKEKIPCEKSST